MAYMHRVTDDFGNMGLSDRRDQPGYSGQRDYPPQPYGPRPGDRPYGSYSSPPPPGPRPGYDDRDYGYNAPPPVPSRLEYDARRDDPYASQGPNTPAYRPPPDRPPLPEGWKPLWDEPNQRWYYAETATGRTQWEAPGFENRGFDGPGGPDEREYAGGPGYAPSAPGGYGAPGYGGGYQQEAPPKEKRGHGGVLLGAAGGLAVGAIGGALLANAFDDDHHDAAPAAAPVAAPVYTDQGYAQPECDGGSPGTLPVYNAYGEVIDSSDRESLQEARDEYEEAQADAASSSASSSDFEELAEAREEYQEEYEEAYYDE